MEPNKTETKVKVDSCNDLNCQNPLIESENSEINLPINENDKTLVATREDAADLNEIPLISISCLLSLIISMFRHIFDFGNDIFLIEEYFANQKTVQGSLTVAITLLQAIASVWISFLMHDPKLSSGQASEGDAKSTADRLKKLVKIIVHIIDIITRPILPSCHRRKLCCVWKIRQCQQKGDKDLVNYYHRKMLKEDRDLAVHEVIACFLQSAPQLILQLFILLTADTAISNPMLTKIGSGCWTLFTLAQAMKEYHCAIRLAQPDKAVIGEIGGGLLLLWHLGAIAARILLIGVAARTWLLYTSLACLINWIGWTAWICVKQNVVSVLHGRNKADSPSIPQTVTDKIRNLILASVVAVVYTFTYIDLGKGRTFIRNSCYYILCLLQNGVVFVLWFMSTDMIMENVGLAQFLLIVSVISFFIGIVAMATYYIFFHPTLQHGSSYSFDVEDCVQTCIL